MSAEIIIGDCLAELPKLPPLSVDLVLSDLPYGVTQNAWDQIIDPARMFAELHRVAKDSAPIILMATQPFASKLITANARYFRYDLIWRKGRPTGFLNANRQPLRSHECILLFYRAAPVYYPQKTQGHRPGWRAVQKGVGSNYGQAEKPSTYGGETDRHPTSVLDFNSLNNKHPDTVHPTQKPVPLMDWLIRSYTNPGAVVLDFAMGSGTTGVAALQAGRGFIGIEVNEEYATAARRRIENAAPLFAAAQ